jgi:hypothetical protein
MIALAIPLAWALMRYEAETKPFAASFNAALSSICPYLVGQDRWPSGVSTMRRYKKIEFF